VTAAGAEGRFALELGGIGKQFGEVVALRHAGLAVRAGTVHALLGENGAGKSTLMQIAFGTLRPDAGLVRVAGAPARAAGPFPGVGMVHQHLSLVPAMTALENFALGGHGLFDREATRRRMQALSDASGLRMDPGDIVRDMSIARQQRLEILKALGRDASVLILDEPTAVLAPAEARDLLAWVRDFAGAGHSVVLVTHKLREALAVADDITVLRRGEVTWAGRAADTTEARLADAIFPGGSSPRASRPAQPAGTIVVRAENASVSRRDGSAAIAGASFAIHAAEIVGIAAVEGSGQHELLLALAGRLPAGPGSLELPGRIAFVPADRKHDATIPSFSLVENVALRGAGRRAGGMPWRGLATHTAALIEEYSITAAGPDAAAGTLSGGNQQRLVIARELADTPALVVADNPTRGLDLNATSFVLERLAQAAARGAAVVLYSNDIDELLTLAHRVLVVHAGRVSEVALDRDAIGRAMLGAA